MERDTFLGHIYMVFSLVMVNGNYTSHFELPSSFTREKYISLSDILKPSPCKG
jgi:hypothetical protein